MLQSASAQLHINKTLSLLVLIKVISFVKEVFMKFMFHEARNGCFKSLFVSITQDSFE